MSGQYLAEIKEQELVQADSLSKYERPKKYKVIILNDDYTPMDFVIDVLKYFFHMDEAVAVDVMLQVHHQGQAVCGIYTKDIAETKVSLVNEYARKHEHPLLCCMEKE